MASVVCQVIFTVQLNLFLPCQLKTVLSGLMWLREVLLQDQGVQVVRHLLLVSLWLQDLTAYYHVHTASTR